MQPEDRQPGETVSLESNVNQETVTLAKLPPAEPPPSPEWSQTGKELSEQIGSLLHNAGEVFEEYKPVIIVIGIALAAILSSALITVFVSVINLIPLLAPTLKLIGFGVTAWFVYRYLLFAPNRQELSEKIKELKEQVLGRQNS